MYDNNIKLIEMPEYDSISVCVFVENKGIFEFGGRIGKQFEDAYMNGYNWAALITYYVNSIDPELMAQIDSDPEAGMFSANMSYSPENLEKMKRFETHIRTMLDDENTLLAFIADNYKKIEWD